jgi:hypothetical protein
VRLQLEIADGPPQRYRAELRTQSGQRLWVKDLLSSHRSGAAGVASCNLPSTLLESGHYLLRLHPQAAKAAGAVADDPIDYDYYFKVTRP